MANRISPQRRLIGRRFNQVCGAVFMTIGKLRTQGRKRLTDTTYARKQLALHL